MNHVACGQQTAVVRHGQTQSVTKATRPQPVNGKTISTHWITGTRSSQAALNIFLKNNKKSRTELQDSSSKLMNEIMFHPLSELFTGCPSKHVSTLKHVPSCQHSATPFSLIQPLFICLTSVSTLHQGSSASPLTQELDAFRT